jgi:hypothetical protein
MRAPTLAFAALLVACGSAKPPTTSLHVAPHASPPGARVTIDDEMVGSLGMITKRGVALPPGRHRITIEAEGYLPFDAEVEAGDHGGVVDLQVELVKTPD